MTKRKRTAPSLAMVLAAVVAAAGPAFATRGAKKNVPDVITVSTMAVAADEEMTTVTLEGDFPLNYLVYQPAPDKLMIEVRDCDASRLAEQSFADSRQVLSMKSATETDDAGTKVTRFTFHLAPRVSHSVSPEGNSLVMRFLGGLSDLAAVAPASAPAPAAPAASASAASRPADGNGLLAYSRTDAAAFAERAGIPSQPAGRALVGVDTAASDSGRVTLLLDGPASYSSFELTDPPRLVVDFEGLANDVPVARVPVDSPYLSRIRVSQFSVAPERVARAVFDLARPAAYEITPTPEGLKLTFSKATLPVVSEELEIASAQPSEAPAPVQPAAAAPAVPEEEDYTYFSESRAPEPGVSVKPAAGLTFESKTISDDRPQYTGRRISLELVDADLKQVFRLFHEISGLNFVLDPSVGGKVTIVLDNVPWDQALDIILRNNGLDKVFENNVVRIATTAKLATEAQQRRTLKDAARLEVDPVTVSRILSYAKAEEVDPIIRRILSARGQSFYDKRTNTIIVTDIPEKVAALNTLMDDLDARTPQVMIEARIVETSREFTRDLGIDWGFLANDQRGAGNSTSISYDLNLPRVANANRLGISFGDLGPNGFSIDLALDALETEGRGRVLSAPKVAAQNNTTAIIEQGVQIPVVNTTATEINVEFISASLKLEVTPQITAEGTIIMDIKVDNSSPDFNNRVGDTPAINTERAQTRVLVEDGGTTVIGGVFLLNEGESETGVPGLRKIPGLGWLFKNKNITKQNRELLIFITPRISL